MDKKDLPISFKEIQTLLSNGYKEKLYLDPERFDKYYIEEFCRLLFYVIDELNDDISNLQKENNDIKSKLASIEKEIEELSRKVRR